MKGNVGKALTHASADDAQLILSLLVWPEECPDPRVVDEWLRANSKSEPDLSAPDRRGTCRADCAG